MRGPAAWRGLGLALWLAAAPATGQQDAADDAGAEPAEPAEQTEAAEPAEAATPAPPAEPNALVIQRNGIGHLSASGIVPSAAAMDILKERLAAAAGAGGNGIEATTASGETPPGWEGLVDAGLAALAHLYSGRVTIRAAGAELTGEAEDDAARQAALDTLGDGPWLADIELLPPVVEPYRFTATLGEDGATYQGHAPDDATAAALEMAVDNTLGIEATGELQRARGMPTESWPALVEAGLEALAAAEKGALEIAGQQVGLTATVRNAGVRRRLEQTIGPGWTVTIDTLDPAPEPELIVTVSPEEGLAARGRLPSRLGIEALEEMLGEIERSGQLTADAYGEKRTWSDAIDAVSIAVPRMEAGEIELRDRSARFAGTLLPGFEASGLSAALRATLGPDWTLDFSIVEAPPESNVSLNLVPGGADVDGILPDGLDAHALLAPLGRVDTDDLAAGGAGAADEWRDRVEASVRALGAFETGGVTLADGEARLAGMLKPGYEAETIRDWLAHRLGSGWDAEVEAQDRPGQEGDRRTDFATGLLTELRGGYWLPVETFDATPETCTGKLDEARKGEAITFGPNSDELRPGERLLLNRLAGVIGHCMRFTKLSLDVNGHTDNRGEPLDNLVLSEQRAQAVVEALAARGVPADRLRAIGYGPDEPIADNATPEGREANRRIDFAWRR